LSEVKEQTTESGISSCWILLSPSSQLSLKRPVLGLDLNLLIQLLISFYSCYVLQS